ncbi:MAG: protein kinase domain-containing protein [Gemmatimonadales bacterium]
MECLKCHTPLPDGSKFCYACGADVTGGGTMGSAEAGGEGLMNRLQRLVEGKYALQRMLGKGGMGAVFLAHDLTLEREVAIKVLPPDISMDEHIVKRFQQEAKTAAKLDHTNIIPIYRVESEGGLNYFVMKYIAGTSLEDVLERKEPLATDYVQRVLWEAACALGHAHQRGIVHRDVKPANIMFDHDGRVMLTDFGISKALQAASGFTSTGMIIGTPHYMAPEQAKGAQVDGRADQYSLAVVGYRMATGELPFGGDSVHTILYKHIFEEAPRAKGKRPSTPEYLSATVARAMSKEPDQRFATMEEFATAVWPEQPVAAPGKGTKTAGTMRPRPKPAVTSETPTEVTSAPTTPLPVAKSAGARPKSKSRAGLVVGIAVLAVGGIGGYLALRGGEPAPPPQPTRPNQTTTTTLVTPPPVQTPAVDSPTAPPPRRTATPTRQAPRRAPVQPVEEFGYITVQAEPYGTVFIDGAEAGTTPIVNWKAKPGRHTIRVERAGYKTITETVQVEANGTVRRRFTLLPEG